MIRLVRRPACAILLVLALVWLAAPAAARPSAEARRTPVVEAVEMVAPAVVNITTARVVERRISPFADFFGPEFGPFFDLGPEQRRRYVTTSLGSGVIIDGRRGLVLTNAHVVAQAAEVEVRLLDGREFGAEVVGSDTDFDLAVLRLEEKARDLPQALLGDSSDIMIGETVIAIGNPFGFTHTVTTGVVSAVGRAIRTEQGAFTDFVQTDAAINPGNSGGPLLNLAGELVGINTAIQARAEGIGFAIPVNKARRVVRELLATGRVEHIWLGLSGQDMDQSTACYFGLPECAGMLVSEVHPDTPAARSDVKVGDVLLSLGGVRVQDKDHYLDLLRNYTAEDELELEFLRVTETRTSHLRGDRFPDRLARDMAMLRWGFDVDDETRRKARGLAVSGVGSGTPAERLGLKRGDIVHQVGSVALKSPEDFAQAFSRYRMKNSVLMKVERSGRWYNVRLKI